MTAPPDAPSLVHVRQRNFAVLVTVAAWMALGFALRLGVDAYLLLGIPVTLAFQRWVARRPLGALWLAAPPPSHRLRAVVVALALAVAPALGLPAALRRHAWIGAAWHLAGLAGAVAAGWSSQRFTRVTARQVAACCAWALALYALPALGLWLHGGHVDLRRGLESFAVYVPICFALEEVFFRGAADRFVDGAGRGGWRTTLTVGVLWGVWHLPVLPGAPGQLLGAIGPVAALHMVLGVPLALYTRRSGSLWPAAVAHALVDGLRNALLPH